MPFRRRTNFPGLEPRTSQELIDVQSDIARDIDGLRAEAIGQTTDTKQSGNYSARYNERVRCLPVAAGLDLTFPEANSKTQNKWIEVLKLGGGNVRVRAVAGEIQGGALLTLATDGFYYFQSDGTGGWWFQPGGQSAQQVFEQIYPIGSIYISTNSTNPATSLGFGTWAAFGAGRVPVGFLGGDPDFGTDEATGGAKTVAAAGTNSAPTFTGTPFTQVINHTHTVTVTDPGHTHGGRHVNNTGGGAAGHQGSTANNNANTTTSATQSATTGITATTANPAGGVASITPAGSVSAPTFTGTPTSVLQPFIVVRMWKRTA